jgi:hypothetical protein
MVTLDNSCLFSIKSGCAGVVPLYLNNYIMALEDRIGDAFGFTLIDDKKSKKGSLPKKEKKKTENKTKDIPKKEG